MAGNRVQLTYLRAVEMADRMLAEGLPVLGVESSHDGAHFTIRFDQGEGKETLKLTFPLAAGILHATATARAALRGEEVTS